MSYKLKITLYSLAAIVLVTITVLVYRDIKASREYEDLQKSKAEERELLEQQKATLEEELKKEKEARLETEAQNKALEVIISERKGNIQKALTEMKETEAEYARRKKKLEEEGKTLSPADLEYELCLDLKRLGYKVTCSRK